MSCEKTIVRVEAAVDYDVVVIDEAQQTFTIDIHDSCGHRWRRVSVKSDMTAHDLYTIISKKSRLPMDQFVLFNADPQRLEHSKRLSEYDIGPGSVVQIIFKLRGD